MIERIEINLLPAEYRVHKRGIRLQREMVYPILGVLMLWLALFYMIFSLDGEISKVENEIRMTEQSIQKNRHIKNEIKKLQAARKNIDQKIRALQRINVNKEKWVRLMEVLCGRLPEYSWLTSLREKVSGNTATLEIDGRTFSFPEVANYMSNLTENEYVSTVDLSNIEEMKSSDMKSSYRFSIIADINPDAGLEKRATE
ncbi:MAG: hypothetical protein GF401_11855 [Chitinivibrionales bacterium]|nr:hypothetical protein [Chitinivibrionales bacterium]